MEEQNSAQPVKCANGCGFFGNPLTGNMCSKCFRSTKQDSVRKEEVPQAPSQITPVQEAPVTQPTATIPEDKTPKQLDTTKCFSCKRKVGLLGFRCRCEYTFCSHHRHADQHTCTFDYKADAKSKLEKANPAVIGSKVNKI